MQLEQFFKRYDLELDPNQLELATNHFFKIGYDQVLGAPVELHFCLNLEDMDVGLITEISTHPHIQEYFGHFDLKLSADHSVSVLILEPIGNASLNDYLKTMPPLQNLIGVFKELLIAINYLHLHGRSYKSLSPNYVRLVRVDNKLMTKLHLIPVIHQELWRRGEHDTGGNLRQIQAPELLAGSQQAGPSTDIWSFGVLLYEVFTGEQPLESLQNRQFTPDYESNLGFVPSPFNAMIKHSLILQPDGRASARDLLQLMGIPYSSEEEE